MEEQLEQLDSRAPIGANTRTDAAMRNVIRHAVAMHQISEMQGETLFWLHNFGMTKGLSNSDLGELLKISCSTVSLIFNGKYAASDWSPMIKKIEDLKAVEEANESHLNLGFVQTSTSTIIHRACDAALIDGMPAFIYGASQIGKTRALLEYQRTHNHGRTKYIRLGSHWTKLRFIREVADACNVKGVKNKRTFDLESLIWQSLNRYNLLIIDEFHLAMETVADTTSREIVESIREIYDRTGCGLVLAATKVGLEDIEQGKNRMLFDQLRRRGTLKIVLPDVPSIKDINAIARSFSLDLPTGETLSNIKVLLKSRGLGVFIKYLQKAHAIARGNDFSWKDFEFVKDGYTALATLENDY